MNKLNSLETPYVFQILLFLLIILSVNAPADDKIYRTFGEHRIFYSAFNSSFIQPDIASLYHISRGKDKGLVNIAVVGKDNKSVAARVSGTVSNIFAQQKPLTFFEVREGDSVYYLAPFAFENEDPLTFQIEVTPADGKSGHNFKFQKTFYHDE